MPGARNALSASLRFGLPLLAAGLLLAGVMRSHDPAEPAYIPMEGWKIPQLVDHLGASGVGVDVVATQPGRAVNSNAFLSTGGHTWRQLNALHMSPDRIDRWRGVVYVEINYRGEEGIRLWGDCGLIAGPFTFFGDPELLGRIRAALLQPSPPTTLCGLREP